MRLMRCIAVMMVAFAPVLGGGLIGAPVSAMQTAEQDAQALKDRHQQEWRTMKDRHRAELRRAESLSASEKAALEERHAREEREMKKRHKAEWRALKP